MSGIMSMLLGAVSSVAVAVDEFFNRVTLLLPGNGTNGAQNNTFLDSSTNNFTITRNGNTTQGTFSPFSQTGWSNYFNQSSRFSLDRTAASFGTNDFTVECWWLADGGQSNYAGIVAQNFASTNGGWTLKVTNTANNVEFSYINSTPQNVVAAINVNDGAWHHLAVTRSGTALRLYVDGGLQTTATLPAGFSFSSGAGNTDIGYQARDNAFIKGYVSNLRLVNGTALSTGSTYTVSTSPLTNITNTSLLTCQSNRFIDNSTANSGSGWPITVAAGTPSVQAFSPFAPTAAYSAATVGGSGYFDGTGDYLSYSSPSTSVREWWLTDWTIEAWVYPTNLSTWGFSNESCLIGNASPTSTTNYWSFGPFTDGTVKFKYFNGSAVTVTSVATVRANQWNHIAMIRNSSGIKIFVNGIGNTFTAVSGTPQSSSGDPLVIGQINNTSIMGYVSGLRIVYGSNVYTNDFTPPTAPPTAITNTSFLLNYTNAGITDATAKNVLETVGNAQISTTQSRFGGGSMYFDGTGDWLVARYNPNLELGSGDFTVEAWVYFSTLPSNAAAAIVSYGDSDNTPRWLLYYDSRSGSANGLRFTVIDGSGTAIILVEGGGTSGWAANTWYHVAVTRSGNSWRLFRDGTQTGSTLTDTDAIPAASNNGLVVGAEPNGGIPLTGYIDDLRITKGYARYTANFTPPTAAFALQ